MVIGLTLAHRFMAGVIITAAKKGDLGSARTITALRKNLQLREAKQIVDEVNENAKAALATLKPGDPPPFQINDYDDMDSFKPESETFNCDEAHLKWLLDLASNHDWSKGERDGKEIKLIASMDMMATFASLVDQLQAATGGSK